MGFRRIDAKIFGRGLQSCFNRRVKACEELFQRVLFLGVADFRVKSYRTGRTPYKMSRDRPALYKGSTSSSITFDPDIGQTQEKNPLKELFASFQMPIETAL